jgi:hypothetical protein
MTASLAGLEKALKDANPAKRAAAALVLGRIGAGEPGKLVQTGPGEEVKGGLIGLIVDARGRPLRLSDDPDTRRARLIAWGQALRAFGQRELFSGTAPGDLAPEPAAVPQPMGFSGLLRPPAVGSGPAAAPPPMFTGSLETSALSSLDLPAPGESAEELAPSLPNSPFAPRRRGTAPLNLPASEPDEEAEPRDEEEV